MFFRQRTHNCGELRAEHVGQHVVLNGWVDSARNLGGLIFVDIRDRYGMTQVVFEPHLQAEIQEAAKSLRSEFVISIEGTVRLRPEGGINHSMATGAVDVGADTLVILNAAKTTPFPINGDVTAGEDLRLKYRYLDLRRPAMQKNLLLRHKMYMLTREYFDQQGFVEIETPVLMKSTPEGARDFLVPSRVHKGKFYALPQSPQTYKQILMVAGMDRYFQIVKCFRDEALRADRQLEFTQIDIEMSFVDVEQIFTVVEGLMQQFYRHVWGLELQLPLPRLTFDEAMETYGSDKPDLRFELPMKTLNGVFAKSTFKVFADTLQASGIITGICATGCGSYTRSQLDALTDLAKKAGAGGLVWCRVKPGGVLEGPAVKFMSAEEQQQLIAVHGAAEGDLLLILSGGKLKTLTIMGTLRLELAKRMELINDTTPPKLLWVLDFPLFEWDDETQRFYAMHHPFTSPRLEDIPLMETDPGAVKARAYDLVLNGSEIAGGSIRIHNQELQQKMFAVLGLSKEEAEEKFGFLLNAFQYGAPPHGGLAFGFDRLAMIFAGEQSIREVIAFPKTASATSLMDDSPSGVDETQLKELHIQIRNS